MSAENASSKPIKGVCEDVKDLAKHPAKIIAAPLLLPVNFLKRSIASAFDLGKEGSEKVLDIMADLSVRTTINAGRHATRCAIAALGMLPIVPLPSGVKNLHEAAADAGALWNNTKLSRYYKPARGNAAL